MAAEWLVIVGLVSTLAGIGYAALVHLVYRRRPRNPYTFVFVIGGCALSLLIGALVVPLEYVAVLFMVFGLTGVWQALGAMHRHMQAAAEAEVEVEAGIRRAASGCGGAEEQRSRGAEAARCGERRSLGELTEGQRGVGE